MTGPCFVGELDAGGRLGVEEVEENWFLGAPFFCLKHHTAREQILNSS